MSFASILHGQGEAPGDLGSGRENIPINPLNTSTTQKLFMQKLAFIDLDGVVCDSTARFARATQGGKINWGLAFHPPMLEMDTLIENADKIILGLESTGWKIIYLSSRPDRLSEACENWLIQHGLGGRELILRPAKKEGLKTPQWKAKVICTKGAMSESLLFVDDEAENREAVRDMWRNLQSATNIQIFESLALVGAAQTAGILNSTPYSPA